MRAVPDTYMVRIGTDADDPAHLHDLAINAVAAAFAETTRAEQIFGTPNAQSLRASAEQVGSAEIAQLAASAWRWPNAWA